jgi:hypothetical protein
MIKKFAFGSELIFQKEYEMLTEWEHSCKFHARKQRILGIMCITARLKYKTDNYIVHTTSLGSFTAF